MNGLIQVIFSTKYYLGEFQRDNFKTKGRKGMPHLSDVIQEENIPHVSFHITTYVIPMYVPTPTFGRLFL